MNKGYYEPGKGTSILFHDIHLVNGARTAFGRLTGTLARISPTDLGIFAARAALDRSALSPQDIHQVIFSHITQSSIDAYFMTRHVGLYSGVPQDVPALLVQRLCGTGFETMISAGEQIVLGKADAVLSGAAENMSLSPTVSYGNRMGYAMGQVLFQDFLNESLKDTAVGGHMGCTADRLAHETSVSRAEADAFALRSQQRAIASASLLAEEIVPVSNTVFHAEGLRPRTVRLPKGVDHFQTDEHPRATTLESLAKLPPAFEGDGVHTAGNSSGIVDGAAASVIVSGAFMKAKNLRSLAALRGAATCGVPPDLMGKGPVPAIELLLSRSGLKVGDIGLFEINEAFAGQFLSCQKLLGLEPEKCNVNGGAIALGHPLSATGQRLALTLSLELNRRGLRYGIAAACIGGGQGTAILLENTNL